MKFVLRCHVPIMGIRARYRPASLRIDHHFEKKFEQIPYEPKRARAMKTFSQVHFLSAALLVAAFSQPALGQNAPTPPPGYFDIPAGFDFPADKRLLEQYR